MRKILLFFIVLMTIYVLPVYIGAKSYNGLEYNINREDDVVIITSYTGSESDVVIPEKIEGYPVQKIEDRAFYCNKVIKSIVIPDTVTTIGNKAFCRCKNLSSVKLSSNVQTIGEYAFAYTAIKNITLPDTLKSIYSFAFSCCDLVSITIPASVVNYGEGLFMNCTSLKEAYLPQGGYIYKRMFMNCSSLATTELLNLGVEEYGLYGCISLKGEIIVKDTPLNITKREIYAYGKCTGLTGIVYDTMFEYEENKYIEWAPNLDGIIGFQAYSGCTGIKSIILPVKGECPDGMDPIAWDSFWKNTVDPESGYVFNNRGEIVYMPAGISIDTLVIPDNIKTIRAYAFDSSSVKNIILPDNVSVHSTSFNNYKGTIYCRTDTKTQKNLDKYHIRYKLLESGDTVDNSWLKNTNGREFENRLLSLFSGSALSSLIFSDSYKRR